MQRVPLAGPDFRRARPRRAGAVPRCGSNGRDRFLHWCLARRVPLGPELRVIENSLRMGAGYRAAMSTWFFYRTSDYDLRATRATCASTCRPSTCPTPAST